MNIANKMKFIVKTNNLVLLLFVCYLFSQCGAIKRLNKSKNKTGETEIIDSLVIGVDTNISQSDYNVMNYVVLSPDNSFASQVIVPNTIYVIRYGFDLGAKEIAIPVGSVLYFIGGNVNNGVLVGQNTEIVFIAGRLACQLSGTFSNENIHIEWFGVQSGKEYANNNDEIIRSYVMPSMERIGNTLYMNPQTEMYCGKSLVFNGTYNLDLRGRLRYTGDLVSTAVSIGTPNTKTNGKSFYINSVIATKTTAFYNKGKVEDNVGVCLWNLKHCNITIGEVQYFGYCLRLCGNIGGCSSNTINFTRLGGNCYYGIHCCSYDSGWVNENTFYCKAIMNYTNNLAKDDMCAIWLDARGENTCNSNVFFAPCVENCHIVMKCTNAIHNIVYDARAEHIKQAMITEGKSRNNALYCKYWDKTGDFSSLGSNRVVKQSEIIPPFVQVFSEQIGVVGSNHYGICFDMGGFTAHGIVNNGVVFGRIVEIADPNQDINIEFVFEHSGRFCIVLLNDDYTFKYVNSLDDYILNTDVTSVLKNGIIRGGANARRISVHLSNKCGKMLIGTYSGYDYGDVVSMNVYSDNLLLDNLYTANNYIFTLESNACVDAFYYKSSSNNFLSDIEKVSINAVLDLKGKTIDLNNKVIDLSGMGRIDDGEVNVTGATIYPNFNALVDGMNIRVQGIPAAGTMYFQNGKPTWSNGTAWIDANGRKIE